MASSTPLNDAQNEAVRYLNGPCLVIAGAGSGKTRVITAKLDHLIRSGFDSRAIAAITFTNKAAAEMAERFAQIRKLPTREQPTICTFHSLGMRMLRESGRAIGLKSSFSIFDADDCGNLVTQLLGTTDRKLARQVANQISLWKNAMIDPEPAIKQARGEFEKRAAHTYRDYQSTLEGYQAVDFDDLIRMPLKLMQKDADAARHWRERLRYFLVDEYQDTNATQYELLRELVRGREAFTAVGDDDQSIYGWRGATLENLKRLATDYPSLRVIMLEQNYRSTRTILDSANTLIERNPKLHPKKLWSALGEGDPVRLTPCDDDEHEAETVAMRLKGERFARKASWSDFAILYRGNHQARIVEQALRKEQIPYQISGGQSFFERAEIKDLCAYLRLMANDDDDPAFIRAATTPKRGIGAQTLKDLGSYAGERNISLFAAAFEMGIESRIQPRQLEPLRAFGEFIHRFQWRAEREPAAALLAELIASIQYKDYLENQADARAATQRWQNVEEFCQWVTKRTEDDPEDDVAGGSVGKAKKLTLLDIAQRIALITRLEGRDGEGEAVRMSTVHASKGLEYPHVFLIGLEEGLMPHSGREDEESAASDGDGDASEVRSEKRLEEERRLMYVAITRAKRTLNISWCRQRKRAKAIVECQPSRFIAEMGLDAAAQKRGPASVDVAKDRLAALRALLDS